LFCQYLYQKSYFGIGSGPKWPLARLYLPFWAEKFFEMDFSLNLMEERSGSVDYFSNICVQKAILEEEVDQNGL